MQTGDRHIQDRLGAAMYRLSAIERRVSAAADSPKMATRLIEDVRKLTGELERAFADVHELIAECARLQGASASASRRSQMLFELAPVPCLVTDLLGGILDANAPAVQLLNVSRRHLVGRSFYLYLGGDREQFLKRIQQLPERAEPERWSAKVRPRERSAVQTELIAALDADGRVMLMMNPVREPLGQGHASSITEISTSEPLANH